jgi:hypothetical protein
MQENWSEYWKLPSALLKPRAALALADRQFMKPSGAASCLFENAVAVVLS